MIPRGIRNNNPGNIRHGSPWEGLAPNQTDKDFCTFINPAYGVRAMAKILMNYKRKAGINTVRGVINRWAPPNENDTEAYIRDAANQLDKHPDDIIDLYNEHILELLILALIRHENGQQPYTMEVIRAGVEAALNK